MKSHETQAARNAAQRADHDLHQVRARQRAIGNQLRGLFDDIVEEGVPEEFDALLDELDRTCGDTPPGRNGRARESCHAGEPD